MKKLLIYLFIATVAIFTSCGEKTEAHKFTKGERVDRMAEQEAMLTTNPFTGEIPRASLYDIRQNIVKSGKFAESREGDEWVSRGPTNVGGRTRGVLVDKRDPSNNTLFVGSVSGGIWKITNATTSPTWERLNYLGNASVTAIVQDPNDLNTLYLGTGEGWFNADAYAGDGIYKSTDGGDNWTRLEATANGNFDFTQKLLFTAEGNLMAATRGGGVQMTLNDGDSWAAVLTNGTQGFSNRAADLEITSDGTIYAAMGIRTQDGIYKSSDNGFQWDRLELGIDDYERLEIATSENDPNVIMAVAQDAGNNQIRSILRSTDQGETWEEKNGGFGFLSDLARDQAWYDLSLAIDPNDSEVVYVGGINLYRTRNGGNSWVQMSQWFNTPNFQYVHSDQHFAQFVSGSSDEMFFGNDGGLWYTSNANASVPNVVDISQGYVSTQFYACDIHPDEGNDFFIAGAQDNGTVWLNQPGLEDGVDINGGDGAFCHINQINPNVIVVASQFGGFRATVNGNLNDFDSYNQPGDDNQFLFINPTDMDDVNNILYSSHHEGEIYRTDLITKANTNLPIAGIFNDQVTALEVDPNNPDLLYLGTDGGNLIRVTNPRSSNPSGEVIRGGSGVLRNVNVDPLNSDRILITFSNFGVQSVFVSEDKGNTWSNIEGDLPDMPVRWGIFSPADSKDVILATELGIWQGTIDGANTSWLNISPEIGLTRVDMLKYRKSDLELVAGTYGRGVFTTSRFAVPSISFNNNNIAVTPVGEFSEDFCNLVETRSVTISTPIAYDTDASITININAESTAVEGVDFEIPTTELVLPAGQKSVSFDILIFDNAVVDGDKLIDLNLEADQDVLRDNLKINILENDEAFSIQGVSTDVAVGDGSLEGDNVFRGFWGNARTQMLYTKDILDATELKAGLIGEISFDVVEKESSGGFNDFTISIGEVTNSEIEDEQFIEDGDLTMVFSGTVTTVEGLNRITFDTPWEYTGENNLLIEICYDNPTTSDNDKIASTAMVYTSLVTLFNDNQTGCTATGNRRVAQQLPNLILTNIGPKNIYEQTEVLFSSEIMPGETAYFSGGDSLLCSVENLNADDVCVTTALYSNSADMVTDFGMLYIDRFTVIESDATEDLSVTIFMPREGSDVWFSDDIVVLYSEDEVQSGEMIDWTYIEPTLVESNSKYIAFTFPYQGDGGYTVGQDMFSSSTDIEIDESYDQVVIFDITGRVVARNENIDNSLPTGIYIKTFLRRGSVVKSEKIFAE